METKRPDAWQAFWQSVVQFRWEKVNPWIGLRNTIGIAIPLAIGAALGNPAGGAVAATGALNVAFRDSTAPYPQRARQMILASFIAGLAVFAGASTGRDNVASVAIAGIAAFGAGMLVAIGDAAADVGAMSVVILVVYAANPMQPHTAALAGLAALGGGLLQTGLSIAMWPFRRHEPERRALGDLYLELSRAAKAPPTHGSQAPPATAQSLQARTALDALGRDRAGEGDRYRFLLSQAERIRLSLLALGRMRTRLGREEPPPEQCQLLDRCFEIAARALETVGNSLRTGGRIEVLDLAEMDALAERLRDAGGPPQVRTTLADARVQLDALAGQLRAAIDVAGENPPEVITQVEGASKPWRLRIGGKVATLIANLNLQSTAFRHAIRLAVCIVMSDALGRTLGLGRHYWIPMTIAIVLKPDFGATFSRGILRLAGTYIGLLLATALSHVLPPPIFMHIAAIALLMFVARCFGPANFGIVAIAISALVVFLIALAGVPPKTVIGARALNTSIGGAIALLAYWLWPTWERRRVAEIAAQMLDAFREYFRAIRERSPQPILERTRVAGRLARSNLEASIERASSEPGASTESIALLNAILAGSRRLAQSLMSLEAAIVSNHDQPVRGAFVRFANDVELTLHQLAAALRGSHVELSSLPDLREDHHSLIHSGDHPASVYALVNVEADRITNSLNTLSDEVMRWVALTRATI